VECRIGCAACCIAPSISALGKPAGERCKHLTAEQRCELFGKPERPGVCTSLRPQLEMCGDSAAQAMETLIRWESLTRPGR
jgi:hypothetical protein